MNDIKKSFNKMSEKILNNTLSEELKEKVRKKIPDHFDLNSIGTIDLFEAEKIANEEIVFLSEDDLIDGLEDFELIPIKSTSESIETPSPIPDKEIINPLEKINLPEKKEIISDDIIFEDFGEKTSEITESSDAIKEFESVDEVIQNTDLIHKEEIVEETEEFVIADESDVIEIDLDEMISNEISRKEISDESEVLKKKINENNFNNQLDDIIKSEEPEDEYEYIPGIYNDSNIKENIIFIDDSHVGKKNKDLSPVYESDPLTENLVKMVEVSEGTLLILDEIAESDERIEYILDNTKTYDAETLALLFKEERFMDDTDFDFIDNAIVRDDYTVYIQEIDDYLKSREVLSGSEVYEILGLLPEEIDYIDDRLFGDYYKEFEDEYELEFISPELSFFDRGFVQKKSLSYFINNKESLLDEEKKSIEDDITSETAIIFEEDILEIMKLLEESGGPNVKQIVKDEIIHDEAIVESTSEVYELSELPEIESVNHENLTEIIDITDKIIILEDKSEIERITSEFPEKHDDLIKLLSYLDGLLEKLPEESIRKFAESEYFDLYVKVLKEIGK